MGRGVPRRPGCWAAAPSIMGTRDLSVQQEFSTVGSGPKAFLNKAGCSLGSSLPRCPSLQKRFLTCLQGRHFVLGAAQKGVSGRSLRPRSFPDCGRQRDNLEKEARGLGTREETQEARGHLAPAPWRLRAGCPCESGPSPPPAGLVEK